jgi:hypothetical protein
MKVPLKLALPTVIGLVSAMLMVWDLHNQGSRQKTDNKASTLSRVGDAKWPESALGEPLALPLIVSGQVDVLPAERRQVLQQFGIEELAVPRCVMVKDLDYSATSRDDPPLSEGFCKFIIGLSFCQ